MEPFDQEIGRELLEEELRQCTVKLGGRSLSEIFEALAETYQYGQWVRLAELLHCDTAAQARQLVRCALPQALEEHPTILRALSLAAGAAMPTVKLGKEEMNMKFTQISEERRVSLIQEFFEDFSALLQEMEPFEVGVEFTGSPQSLVLLDLVRRYFRGRFLVEPCFPRLSTGASEKLDTYRETIRAFYGLDPLEGPPKALAKEAVARGIRVLVRAIDPDPFVDTAKTFEKAGIHVVALLNDWTADDVLSYADIQNLVVFELLVAEASEEPEGEEITEAKKEWSRDKRGLYRRHGKMVKQATVPAEVRRAFEGEPEQTPENDVADSAAGDS